MVLITVFIFSLVFTVVSHGWYIHVIYKDVAGHPVDTFICHERFI